MFSKRLPSSIAINQITKWRLRHPEKWNLAQTNPTKCNLNLPMQAISDSLCKPFKASPQNKSAGEYAPDSRGSLLAREALCKYLIQSRKLDAGAISVEQIFLCGSTSEAYGCLLKCFCDPGDTVVVPRPGYPLLDSLVTLENCQLASWPMHYTGSWGLGVYPGLDAGAGVEGDAAATKSSVTQAQVKCISIVNPNNPTGHYLDPTEFDAYKQLPVIADEVFYQSVLEFKGAPQSFMTRAEGLTITLGGLSKELALPQMKLAWMVVTGPKQEVQSCCDRLEIISDTYLSANTPAMLALPHWLDLAPQIGDVIRQRCFQNLEQLDVILEDAPEVTRLRVEGGWSVLLQVPHIISDEKWVELFLKSGVWVQPGYLFDFSSESILVLSLLVEPTHFKKGVEKMTHAMQTFLDSI